MSSNIEDAVYTFIGGFIITIVIAYLIISLLTIIGKWKAFKKASKPGWASIIPIYNYIVFLEIAELPLWYIILYAIPLANIYVLFKSNIEFAKKYSLHPIYGVGLALVPYIFWLIIGLGPSNYYKNNQNSFCTNCGYDLKLEKYCPNCGKKA